jgi:UDP-N-acetylmuramate--alanine ligase
MRPEIAVVLNIEADHLDYHGDEAHVIASFERFVRQVKPGGHVILCWDDPLARTLCQRFPFTDPGQLFGDVNLHTYFVHWQTHGVHAADIDLSGPHPSFTLKWAGTRFGRVTLNVPGLHNIQNALAAYLVGSVLGIPDETIIQGLESFTGTGRRFERIGEANGVLVVDDYAHHPTEVRATLAAARAAYPDQRIVAVFQPHLPSRTRDLMDGFADALAAADAVYLTDIYLAREQPLTGVSSETLAERTRARGAADVTLVANKNDLPARLAADVRPGDLVLTLGAGDIRSAATGLLERLKG